MAQIITAVGWWTVTRWDGSASFTMGSNPNQVDGDGDPIWPRFVNDGVKGLRALPDQDDNREDNTERIGERPLAGYARGKTLSITGRIYGRTWIEAHAGADLFLEVLAPELDTGARADLGIVIAPQLPGGNDQSWFGAQCRAAEAVERYSGISPTEQPSEFRFDFTFDLRMADPRFLAWDGDTVIPDSEKW